MNTMVSDVTLPVDDKGMSFQKLQLEKDRKELYTHLAKGLADDEAGRFITEEELKTHMHQALGQYV